VRRLTLLAVLALGLAACGGSGTQNLKITFGLSGGTMRPYSVTIAPGGAVTTTGLPYGKPKPVTSGKDAELSGLVRKGFADFKNDQCPGTFPDESAMFITALGRTITVRGSCEPGFTQLWNSLITSATTVNLTTF